MRYLYSLFLLLLLAGCGKEELAIQRLDDARHARIGVMTGSTGEKHVAERLPQADLKSFDNIMDAVSALKAGQIDGVVTAYPAANLLARKNPDIRLVAEPMAREDTAIAVRPGDAELLAAVERIVGDLKREGVLDDMARRWVKADDGPYVMPDIPLPSQGKPLRIGVNATREPFSFVDAAGRFTGLDAELSRYLGARLGRPLEYVDMKFMALIPALQSGKVDLIVTGMTATPERRKHVAFTQPYYANAQVMLVRKSPAVAGHAPPTFARQEDIADQRLGVIMGTVHDKYAAEHYPKAQVSQFKSLSDMLLALKSQKIDAAFYTSETLREILRHDPELAILGPRLFDNPIGMGFRKGNDELRQAFNAFLKESRASGQFDDIVKRWVSEGDTRMPEIPNPGDKGVLLVGTVGDKGLPFTVIQDNRLIGSDVELTERFGAYLGKRVKFVDMEFGSLIAAVATGKIDMIASTLMLTEERKAKIDFSDPYMELGASVFVLKSRLAGEGDAAGKAPGFWQGVRESFHSNLILEKRYLLIWDGLKTTVVISIFATLFGTALGALVCRWRMSRQPLLREMARFYIALLRGLPVLVLLMLIYYVVFASVDIEPTFVAVVAFGLHFAAYVSEMFRTGIEGVDRGQTEAGIAMGFTPFQTFRLIVLPQATRRILPVYRGEFISLVKMTSIVGYIGVQDLTKASDIIRSRTFEAFFPLILVAAIYFLIIWLLGLALDYIEARTARKGMGVRS